MTKLPRSKRHCIQCEYNGKSYPSLKKMVEENNTNGLSYAAVKSRIINGWSLENALTAPYGSRNPAKAPSYTVFGKSYVTLSELISDNKHGSITNSGVYSRLHKGWPLEQALTYPLGSKPPISNMPIKCSKNGGQSG